MLMAITATLAGSALADSPPAQPADTGPATSLPAVTTTEPVDPQPPLPVTVTVPGTPLRLMLIKRVRAQLVPTRKTVWHLQSLMGLHRTPGGNIWDLGSPQAGKEVLAAWRSRQRMLSKTAKHQIKYLMDQVDNMNRIMGQGPVRVLFRSGNIAEQYAQARRLHRQVQQRFDSPPDYSALMCIHHYEGSWTDSGAPYWGGLQMDLGFQSHYGGWLLRTKGTADHWTMWEQIWTAEKAIHSGRGFYPWPNTARFCGLI